MMQTKKLSCVIILILFISEGNSDQIQGYTDDEDIDKLHQKSRRATEGSGINACDNNDCHADADCVDLTETSYECKCKSGFYGTGKDCMPDLCKNKPCPANRKCQNILGANTYSCDCKRGWVKVQTANGEICTNRGRLISIFGRITCVAGPYSIFNKLLNSRGTKRYRDYEREWCRDVAGVYKRTNIERLYSGCSVVQFRAGSVEVSFESYFSLENTTNTTSSNVISEAQTAWDKTGVFSLHNTSGYHVFGQFPVTPKVNITDLDECAYSDVQGCHDNAFCTNTDGSYNCTCSSGYTGDGFNCTDYNECDDENICGPDAICINSEGSYSCMKKMKASCMERVSYVLIVTCTTLVAALIPLAYYAWSTKSKVDKDTKNIDGSFESWHGR